MVSRVGVRISNVDNIEISELVTLIKNLQNGNDWKREVDQPKGQQDFVVIVKNGELREIKDALRAVLKVVKAERIEIEP